MAMEKMNIRLAVLTDAPALADVKARYIRALYRGYVAADCLKRLDASCYLPQISDWIQCDSFSVALLERQGEITGFIVYGSDQEDPGHGLIREVAVLPSGSSEDCQELLRSGVDNLAGAFDDIHLWVVRDNFRMRFHFEQAGFRADGQERMEQIRDPWLSEMPAMPVRRYSYQIR